MGTRIVLVLVALELAACGDGFESQQALTPEGGAGSSSGGSAGGELGGAGGSAGVDAGGSGGELGGASGSGGSAGADAGCYLHTCLPCTHMPAFDGNCGVPKPKFYGCENGAYPIDCVWLAPQGSGNSFCCP